MVSCRDEAGEPFRVRGLPVGEFEKLGMALGDVEHAERQCLRGVAVNAGQATVLPAP